MLRRLLIQAYGNWSQRLSLKEAPQKRSVRFLPEFSAGGRNYSGDLYKRDPDTGLVMGLVHVEILKGGWEMEAPHQPVVGIARHGTPALRRVAGKNEVLDDRLVVPVRHHILLGYQGVLLILDFEGREGRIRRPGFMWMSIWAAASRHGLSW
ncbi:hypothetical protein MBM_03055 [Drepanopeziza brunnea f. sp. 'multigermtubi' MB_m1]|uniref:Uncharacterized protein n=1 Tax=Marssonina brunnea f. sp. multigermtubi (strain MB_m1) TaxID=1072389 RepID=K1XD95_MARBU|nr:uncharacterized protein MBM_03055 [Drepanopeziza brunnea f. sp. 'multigermtubi' MB_m1]EKD18813.1 hypothetical protein MBM_03055 [Drepanopeziza brunnea f. sp. 'multigermtubi' MB_m1]